VVGERLVELLDIACNRLQANGSLLYSSYTPAAGNGRWNRTDGADISYGEHLCPCACPYGSGQGRDRFIGNRSGIPQERVGASSEVEPFSQSAWQLFSLAAQKHVAGSSHAAEHLQEHHRSLTDPKTQHLAKSAMLRLECCHLPGNRCLAIAGL
jgi:hypothetical protein